ncbi:type II toxin-antitoxin system HipA family toxin [Herbaspirillum huttiense]|uniref:HipA domain-containing protein n=1 Tax=Herbaspirillum huttiense TaxID=863372 RepID=UPI001064ADDB|nr:HipA domain-containing protein [Herbaspirillum huttiense]QBP75951.1 type II toxin-antitoxin system HipA family toxin [Herbaspirillum huttiense]
MSMFLNIWMGGVRVGELWHHTDENLFSLRYDDDWTQSGHALSPALPLIRPEAESRERHSMEVRNFFQNLLPEGKALDDAVATYHLSKANLAGLLHALGRESAGALVFSANAVTPHDKDERQARRLSSEELSQRIRARPEHPFTVWDGRVRLSIAGYQDKLAVLQQGDAWFLPETLQQSSTHILKPEPVSRQLAGMTTNELMCMLLADAVGVRAAAVRLAHVPEPVLVVERFDRVPVRGDMQAAQADGAQVLRRQCIDGCQALGLPVDFKYERPFGDGDDVKEIRDGASLKRFFRLLGDRDLMHSTGPAKLGFLRWLIFQVLIGNTDAHAKNLSFFSDANRLVLAPAYDMVSGLALIDAQVADQLAMAVGDNFDPRTIRAFDWALMAHECALAPRLVVNALKELATLSLKKLPDICHEVLAQGGDPRMTQRVASVVQSQCEAALACAKDILTVNPAYL